MDNKYTSRDYNPYTSRIDDSVPRVANQSNTRVIQFRDVSPCPIHIGEQQQQQQQQQQGGYGASQLPQQQHAEPANINTIININDIQTRTALIYSIAYYIYMITINIIGLVIIIAGIIVTSDIFDNDTDRWIVLVITIAEAIKTGIIDMMNGFDLQGKKNTFGRKVYTIPKWSRFL